MTYEAETIQKRARRMADDMEKHVEQWAEIAFQEGWDGREIIVAMRNLFVRYVMSVGGTPEHACAMIRAYDSNDNSTKLTRQASLLVAPNGRPLHRVG